MAAVIELDSKKDSEEYPGHTTIYVIVTSVLAAMGGLIFGYDIGITGSVTSMAPFLHKFFPSVHHSESTNGYCKFNDKKLRLFTSSLYLSAFFTSFVASSITSRFGRKTSMFLGGIIYFFGAAINAFSQTIWMLIIGRLLLGVGIGFTNQSVPLYLSEMAPSNKRGVLNAMFQLAITVGILSANIVNYFAPKFAGSQAWRWSLGIASIPAFIIFVSSIFLCNSPSSFLQTGGDREKARAILRRIRGLTDKEVEAEFNAILSTSEEASIQVKNPWNGFLQRHYRPQLIMAILIPIFRMNVIMFFAPLLLKTIGLADDAALLSALIIGLVNFLGTIYSFFIIEKFGRRTLFLAGGTALFTCEVLEAAVMGWKFGVSGVVTHVLPKWYAVVVVLFICAYVFAFTWSWGPLGWLVPSEIFPLENRSAGQSLVLSANMFATFIVAELFIPMLCWMKFGLLIFFAVFMAAMTAFIYFFLPETKKVPMEEMSRVWKQHWYWKRFAPKDPPK